MGAQRWDAAQYARNGRFVADLAAPLVDVLAPRPGERILDLGCGDGALSAEIAAAGADVIGIDASADMVEAARARSVDARCGRGEALDAVGDFDAVFSNAALHWMEDLDAVFAGVARALRPGGRFVAEMGGAGNIAAVVAALDAAMRRRGLHVRPPWTFPGPEAVATLLTQHRFRIEMLEWFDRPTLIPGDLSAWLETFAGTYIAATPEAEREGLIEEVRETLRPALHSDTGWTLDYVRLRFAARLVGGRDSAPDPKPPDEKRP
ncbi:MAG: class I SAM-dependent methyltransferase [Rhodospirillales bacterium]|nr:class I SAM-dependent methyltransferase [Rhodospirillales bacterium]